ncbi:MULTISPECIES: rhamnulokinase family protein [unclassified Leucobacter]|uniref:rhamnulokinase n=1 Tax=unclassified Leucobacter TaxID=2621730 RepID=UPI00165D3E92|nr:MULTISPECIES: rhamnulokinase family protein [unclassified Leucobacter]MBC9926418.1 rhamnulokinase [Leucobacter sp. cx-169]
MTKRAKTAGAVAAVDLGATSGRVIVGRVLDGTLDMRHVSRFANDPVRTRDGLHWNLLELYRQVVLGLSAAEREEPGEIASVGIDSWAVDYGLMRGGRLLGMPFHYRDERNDTGVASVHSRIGAPELYARNGLQHLPFNTVFQLATEGELLGFADQMLLVPDLLNFWLTGQVAAERTNASTTGLLDARTGEWDLELARRLDIPERLLPRLIDAGAPVGRLIPEVAREVGRTLEVVAVGSHDTASAVVAIPNTGTDFAYISCGTWGLVGLELEAPVLTEAARAANFTNEGGVDGRTRFLHNVMGLWLVSESLRHWEPTATDAQRASLLGELLAEAARVSPEVPVFDVNDPAFMPTGDIPERIRGWYRAHGERVPETRGEIVRCIIESLAQAFAEAVVTAGELADHDVSVIHLVGGGSQNALLCQATANRSGKRVVAGPIEATAMGNLLVQARAIGQVGSGLEAIREVVRRSTHVSEYLPE